MTGSMSVMGGRLDGRLSGRQYGIGYTDIRDAGYVVPIVELDVQYKQFQVRESAIVETRYIRRWLGYFLNTLSSESDDCGIIGFQYAGLVNKATGLLELPISTL